MMHNGLSNLLAGGRSTALVVLQGERELLAWGDVAASSSTASVRKSLISALFGIAIGHGQIRLDATLAELGIDDREGLSPVEKEATVADLLSARSGVYHPAVYDTPNGRPTRHAFRPGDQWFYNNWDFNVLATIYRQQTGHTFFQGLATELAAPLGMEDFHEGKDGFFLEGPQSIHPVYKLRMSARDLVRFGLLYLRHGSWHGIQVVPADWIRESTRTHTDLGGGRGYGYLWWTAAATAPGDALRAPWPLFYASGFGGQYVIVIPSIELVVVHRAARVDHGIDHGRMGEILQAVLADLC